MDRIDDDKIVFYFEHQRHIDEWASLPRQAREATSEWLRTVSVDLATAANDLGADLYEKLDDAWPLVGLRHRSWPMSIDGTPRVLVALSWQHNAATFAGQTAPFVGVRTAEPNTEGRDDAASVRAAVRVAAGAWLHSPYWALYRYERATGEYWKDLRPYREQLLATVSEVWDLAAPLLDGAFPERRDIDALDTN